MAARKPKLAVWQFASCDGCQLTLLDCEDELLALAGRVTIALFPEASSARLRGPYDLSLVEGSITMPGDVERLREIRRSSRTLITIGACAASGGVQALRNLRNVDEAIAAVYAHPGYIDTLATSTAIADHVPVDFELRGCPISKAQLLEVVTAFLAGRRPAVRTHAVCVECKRRGLPCLLVARGAPCLGPVTQAGCGALCPAWNRACFGCFGPAESPNTAALAQTWRDRLGMPPEEIARAFRVCNPNAPAFREQAAQEDRDG